MRSVNNSSYNCKGSMIHRQVKMVFAPPGPVFSGGSGAECIADNSTHHSSTGLVCCLNFHTVVQTASSSIELIKAQIAAQQKNL